MKAVLEFNLPEESEAHFLAFNGHLYSYIVSDVLEHIRGKIKYSEITEEQHLVYEELKRFIIEDLNDKNINKGI